MHHLIQQFSKKHLKKNIPDLKPGDTVKVYQKIYEADKERVQIFEGVVIATKGGKTINASFTVRKISVDGIGVEKTYPLHSPTIVKIERLKQAKVRRAKLYYLRELSGKAARLKEKVSRKVWEEPEAEKELEKIHQEQAMQAQIKEQEKAMQQEELEKKFEAVRGPSGQASENDTSQTPDSGQPRGKASPEAPTESGLEDTKK